MPSTCEVGALWSQTNCLHHDAANFELDQNLSLMFYPHFKNQQKRFSFCLQFCVAFLIIIYYPIPVNYINILHVVAMLTEIVHWSLRPSLSKFIQSGPVASHTWASKLQLMKIYILTQLIQVTITLCTYFWLAGVFL